MFLLVMLDMMIIYLTTMFLLGQSPMILTLILMLIIISIVVKMALAMNTSWISYIFMMIFISGLMVIILYVASLSSNENMKFKMNIFYMVFFLPMFPVLNNMMMKFVKHNNLSQTSLDSKTSLIFKSFTYSMLLNTLFMILFLYYFLIISIYLISKLKMPSRE